ncbi:hypothetical protein JL2886_02281 [Phaeobacter gallaeciensis]|uniref:Uncharacterized protein n=1 Tax=Phaeobacter gallaeciensis TaxID=60890 RepID=A0A1B0ZSL8_9RHOB|nr:hypothetical protein JL2886_02281 [Phaeobacter gallaeciensis]
MARISLRAERDRATGIFAILPQSQAFAVRGQGTGTDPVSAL